VNKSLRIAAFLTILFLLSCEAGEPAPPPPKVEFKVLTARFHANIRPYPPNDPIILPFWCYLDLRQYLLVEVRNPTNEDIHGVNVVWMDVLVFESEEHLAQIGFLPYNLMLPAQTADTLFMSRRYVKPTNVAPPCHEKVFFRLMGRHNGSGYAMFDSDTLTMTCRILPPLP
jgi:hypothetical protein